MNTELVEDFLRETIGLDSESLGRAMISRVVHRRMREAGIGREADYVRGLRTDVVLRQQLVEELVVPETWFFRDREPFSLFARLAAARRAAGRRVHVLSLPCATGEESYSIAIALLGAGFAPEDFRLDSIDISEAAIRAARRASYGPNSFRESGRVPPAAWFEPDGARWRPMERVRDCVRFRQGNLFELAGGEDCDFVFCRNLLIYFDAPTQALAMKRLLGALARDGVLFVGHAEAAVALREGLSPRPESRTFAFSRAPGRAQERASPPRARARVRARPVAPEPRPFADVVPGPPREEPAPASLADMRALADSGRLAEAEAAVKAHVDRHGPTAEAWCLIGVLHDARGDDGGAERAYRKALYLDPKQGEAITHLALLLERRGDPGAAQLWRRAGRAASHERGGAA